MKAHVNIIPLFLRTYLFLYGNKPIKIDHEKGIFHLLKSTLILYRIGSQLQAPGLKFLLACKIHDAKYDVIFRLSWLYRLMSVEIPQNLKFICQNGMNAYLAHKNSTYAELQACNQPKFSEGAKM